jgi:hypothetical protein
MKDLCLQFRPATPDVRNGTVNEETAASCDATSDNKDDDDDSAVSGRPQPVSTCTALRATYSRSVTHAVISFT